MAKAASTVGVEDGSQSVSMSMAVSASARGTAAVAVSEMISSSIVEDGKECIGKLVWESCNVIVDQGICGMDKQRWDPNRLERRRRSMSAMRLIWR